MGIFDTCITWMLSMSQLEPGSKDSSALFNAVMERIPMGIIALDRQGNVKFVNQFSKELLALGQDDLMPGSNLISRLGHLHPLEEELENFLKQAETPKYLDPIGYNERSLDISFHGLVDGFLVFIYDISRLKVLEAASIQAILTSQENEIKRMAREIHDGIGPLLSSAKLELDLFLEDLGERDQSIPDHRLLNIRQTIDSISGDLRDLSHRLMPRLLEEFGLLSAFQNMVSRMKSAIKTDIDLYCNLDPKDRFDRDIELNLFRCGQELLNNAIKHSGAENIILQLIKHEDSIVLMIEDDGSGFNPEEAKNSGEGIGLMNVETRIRALHGEFIIEAGKNRGSLVSLEVPL